MERGATAGWIKRGRLLCLFFALILIVISDLGQNVQWVTVDDGGELYDITLAQGPDNESMEIWQYQFFRSYHLAPLTMSQCDEVVLGGPEGPNVSFAGLTTCTWFSYNFMLDNFVTSQNRPFFSSCKDAGIKSFALSIVCLFFIFLGFVSMLATALTKKNKARWRFVAVTVGVLASLFEIAALALYMQDCLGRTPPTFGKPRGVSAGVGYAIACVGVAFCCLFVAFQFWFFCCKLCRRGQDPKKKMSSERGGTKAKSRSGADEDDGGFGRPPTSPKSPKSKDDYEDDDTSEPIRMKSFERDRDESAAVRGGSATVAWQEVPTSSSSTSLPKPKLETRRQKSDWTECREGEDVYWYNQKTQEISWAKPE